MTTARKLTIRDAEIELTPIRAQGAGGQNVNKVSSAIHLRFDIQASSLADDCKQRLLELKDQRITREGVIIIKAQRFRTQEKNRDDAVLRLHELVSRAMITRKPRQPTKPTKAAKTRRLNSKTRQGQRKALRGKVDYS